MTREYSQTHKPSADRSIAPAWDNFDFTYFSDISFADTSDTAMQQISDGLLLQPLLDSSSPAVGADQYDAWDWAGDRHDQPESFLPEAVPHGTLDHTQRQGLAKAAQTGAVGETVNISREVHYEFEERINQRLVNVEEQFQQKLLDTEERICRKFLDTEERICRKLTDTEERIYAELAELKETLGQSETRVEAMWLEIGEDKKRICREAEESFGRLEVWKKEVQTYMEVVRSMHDVNS